MKNIRWLIFGLKLLLASKMFTPFTHFQVALISTIYMTGLSLGAVISGTVDKFGRKSMLLLSIFLAACGGLGNAFATSYWTFCTFRFFTASG